MLTNFYTTKDESFLPTNSYKKSVCLHPVPPVPLPLMMKECRLLRQIRISNNMVLKIKIASN